MARTRSYSFRVGLQAGVLPYRYELAPYVWDTSLAPSHWRLPASAVGGVDLRPLAAQAAVGGTPVGFAFAACRSSPGAVALATHLHMNDCDATTTMRDAWQGAMGYRPAGAKLTDLLWDQITTGSDPTGQSGPKPLVPGVDNVLRLFVGGHSEVKREVFRWGAHPHTDRLRAMLRREFAEQWERTNGHDHCRRCLDFTCRKYRVDDWREFVPARLHQHVPGRLPHATTITESFPGTSSTLGGDLTWTELSDFFANASGEATHTTGSIHYARAESDLSSDDHYAQFKQTGTFTGERAFGPCARFDPSAATCYDAYYYPLSGLRLNKVAAGTQTNLADAAVTPGATEVWKVECDGSAIKSYQTGVERSSVTDTAITGNTRCGLVGYGSVTGDDFEAADLGGGGGSTVPAKRHSYRRRRVA